MLSCSGRQTGWFNEDADSFCKLALMPLLQRRLRPAAAVTMAAPAAGAGAERMPPLLAPTPLHGRMQLAWAPPRLHPPRQRSLKQIAQGLPPLPPALLPLRKRAAAMA